jgi:hypothetical protein
MADRITAAQTILASIIELLPLRTHWLVAIQKNHLKLQFIHNGSL